VIWFQHAEKTSLRELAHSQELFLLDQCQDVEVETFIGWCDNRHLGLDEVEPPSGSNFLAFFYRYGFNPEPLHHCNDLVPIGIYGCVTTTTPLLMRMNTFDNAWFIHRHIPHVRPVIRLEHRISCGNHVLQGMVSRSTVSNITSMISYIFFQNSREAYISLDRSSKSTMRR
jgi:hypothetical protein